MSIPPELVLLILRRPELKGCAGLLRCVCSSWAHIVQTPSVSVSLIMKNMNVFKWAKGKGCEPLSYDHALLGEHGGIDVLEEFIRIGRAYIPIWNPMEYTGPSSKPKFTWNHPFYDSIWKGAASRGSVEVLEMLLQHARHPSECRGVCEYAAERGHLEALKWLRKHKAPWGRDTIHGAIRGGHLNVLEWAYENKCEELKNPAIHVAYTGNLEMFKWYENNKFWMDESAVAAAASKGHLDMLKYLKSRGYPMDKYVCSQAAGAGHHHVLKWARENDCPWDSHTSKVAATWGNLDVLKWAVENGCPCDDDICEQTAKAWQLECLKWAVLNGFPFDVEICKKAAVEGFMYSSLGYPSRRGEQASVIAWLESIKK